MRRLFVSVVVFLSSYSQAQIISTVAGCGSCSLLGDGGPASTAQLSQPGTVIFDSRGDYYTGNPGQNRIRMVDTNGIIHTVAGNGSCCYSGDGGPATNAQLNGLGSGCAYILFDRFGNLIIADGSTARIRSVDHSTGIISTIVGRGVSGFGGDGGPATGALLNNVGHIAIDPTGNLFITDVLNSRIRKVDTSGIITTVAGYGGPSVYGGDGGPATAATFTTLQGIACDHQGNLYVADRNCYRVRRIDHSTGTITTFAGNGSASYSGDGMPATSAALFPQELSFDSQDNLYISDYYNNRVYLVDTANIFHLLAGSGTMGFGGDGGPATSAQFHDPWGVGIDSCGNVYIADDNNERIRKITFYPTCGTGTTIVEAIQSSGLSLFPNPVTSELTVEFSKTISSVSINTLQGQSVYDKHCDTNKLVTDVSSFPAGVYLVRINGMEVRRFVKL